MPQHTSVCTSSGNGWTYRAGKKPHDWSVLASEVKQQPGDDEGGEIQRQKGENYKRGNEQYPGDEISQVSGQIGHGSVLASYLPTRGKDDDKHIPAATSN
jgi:hypothetical protein